MGDFNSAFDGSDHFTDSEDEEKPQESSAPCRVPGLASRRRDLRVRFLRLLASAGELHGQASTLVREGVQVASLRQPDDRVDGRRGQQVGAAERRAVVRAVVSEIPHGADGEILHPTDQREPPKTSPWPHRRILQVV